MSSWCTEIMKNDSSKMFFAVALAMSSSGTGDKVRCSSHKEQLLDHEREVWQPHYALDEVNDCQKS